MTRRMVWAAALGAGGALLAATWHSRRVARNRHRTGTWRHAARPQDRVTEESEESFPASDPPSHTPTTGTRF